MKKPVTKEELEKAYALIATMEQDFLDEAYAARTILFADVQAQLNEQSVPKFGRGATMTQAFRMGMDTGVTCAFTGLDNIGALVIDSSERMLTATLINDAPDVCSLADTWADYINS